MGTAKDSEQTKQKLIEVAGVLFAEQGYKQVTVRDIIEAAQANLGALNYHFGGKENLYREVMAEACRRDSLDLAALQALNYEQQLQHIILDVLNTYDQDITENWPCMLIKRECQFPSHLVDQQVEQHFKTHSERLAQIVSAITQRSAQSKEVEFAMVTLVGLMDVFGLNERLIAQVLPALAPFVKDHEQLAQRIASLVLQAAA